MNERRALICRTSISDIAFIKTDHRNSKLIPASNFSITSGVIDQPRREIRSRARHAGIKCHVVYSMRAAHSSRSGGSFDIFVSFLSFITVLPRSRIARGGESPTSITAFRVSRGDDASGAPSIGLRICHAILLCVAPPFQRERDNLIVSRK